jgi:hypothetical protein
MAANLPAANGQPPLLNTRLRVKHTKIMCLIYATHIYLQCQLV